MLQLHNKSSITIVQGDDSWTIEVTDQKFGARWTEFKRNNVLNKKSYILLRHIGNLKFDIIQFTEHKMHTYLSWIVPLSNILQLQYSANVHGQCICCVVSCQSYQQIYSPFLLTGFHRK